MDTAIVLMDKAEAREIIASIKAGIAEISALILDLHNREGWRALGYESWRACVVAEFEFSQSHAYRLLSHGQVVENIKDSHAWESGEPLPINPTQSAPLTKLPPEQQPVAWQQATETAAPSPPTSKQVATATDEFIGFPKQAQVNKGKGTKQSVNTSGGSWGTGAGIDAEFEQGGQESGGFTLEELQTLMAEYDTGDKCPYCNK